MKKLTVISCSLIWGFLLFLALTKQVQGQIIVIDAGHGYNADGSNGDGRTTTEITTNWSVSIKLRDLIQNNSSWTVHLTRPNNGSGSQVSINDRWLMANNWNANMFLSIHCNAGGGTGTETFYCNNNDPTPAPDISFATEVQAKMVQYGVWADRRVVEDNSYLGYHLGVLNYSTATACLNEIGFVDKTSDAAKLLDNTWRDKFANAYYAALQNNLGGVKPSSFTLTLTPECNVTISQIRLNWTVSVGATSYDIYRDGSLYYNMVTTDPQFINNSNITVGTSYSYYVQAKNTSGSTNSNTQTATALNCTPTPIEPGNLVSLANGTTVNLKWTDNSTNENGFRIERKTGASGTYSEITAVGANVSSYSNSGVSTNQIYYYRLRAYNSEGNSGYSNEYYATTMTASSGLGASAVSSTQINLTWTDNALGETGFKIERKTGVSGAWTENADLSDTSSSYSNTGLIANTTYYYRVRAYANSTTDIPHYSSYSNEANATVTSIEQISQPIPDHYLLAHNFPNPFNPTTTIMYDLPKEGIVTIKIYDLLGIEVKTLVDEYKSAGSYSVEFNAGNLSSGTYFYRITTGDFTDVKKLILMR